MSSFVLMLSGLPCVAPCTIQIYGEYLEKCAFIKCDAIVESVAWLKLKLCGVATQHDLSTTTGRPHRHQSVLIAKVLVADDIHLGTTSAPRLYQPSSTA